jgi:hypothetical protein
MPTQRQLNAAQVSKGSFNANEVMCKSAKAAQRQQNAAQVSKNSSISGQRKASRVGECNFKAVHAASRRHMLA